MKRAGFISAVGATLLLLFGCGNEPKTSSQMASSVEENADNEMVGPDVWLVDKSLSAVKFRAVQEGKHFEGAFSDFDIAVKLDPNNLEDARIVALIDLASVDAGDADRNASLPAKDWFHVKQHPQAKFFSDQIAHLEGEKYAARGTLTLKGVEKPVTLPFALRIDGEKAIAAGKVTLIRTDFNVGEGAYADDKWVGFEVEVEVNVAATRAKP